MSVLSFFRKRPASPPPQTDDATSVLCMVLSQRSGPPDDSTVRAALKASFGRKASVTDSGDGVWMLTVPHLYHAFLSFMPAPIPTGEAEAAADSFLWPNGSRFAAHNSHAVVGSAGAHPNRVAAALALTTLATAALQAFDGTAVYWGAGTITIKRDQFMEFANGATSEHLPLYLWCRFQLVRPAEGRIGLYTVGLRQFGLMEIEVDDSAWQPSELLEFTYNIAHYLIQSGPVINDGDTVGGSEAQRIVVRHGVSSSDPANKAYKIVGT